MEFEWDLTKNNSNIEKHGINFEDAKDVFSDSNRISVEDVRQEYGEKRWITIGKAQKTIIVVVYTIRKATRIISARFANKKERLAYSTLKN